MELPLRALTMNSAYRLCSVLGLLLAFGLPAIAVAQAGESPPVYMDPDRPVAERVADLISRLTLEEKATLLNHRGPIVERFNIRADQWNQCLHGVSWDGGPTTLFPIPTALAATWNTQLVHQVASAISDEARAIYNSWHDDPNFKGTRKGLIYRSPVINILRNPYWGRNGEAWSEDPFLCGRMAVAFVKGLQGDDPHYLKLASTLKHFAVNNVERGRASLSASVSERMLHEYWLPHFKDAVVEGKAQSLMASYNAINSTPNNINRWLLTDLLKNDWKHEGFVVSDLGGVRTMVEGHGAKKMSYVDAVAQSLMAGCDFSDKEFMEYIPAAVHEGKLTEGRLNDAVARVLTVRFRLGEFDPPERVPYRKIPMSVVCSPQNRRLSLEASRQSIVLLQNKGDLLPLDRARLRKLAVVGPLASQFVAGDANYIGNANRNTINVLQGIRDLAGGIEVVHAVGAKVTSPAPSRGEPLPETSGQGDELRQAAQAAKDADVAIVCVGTTLAVECESRDRSSLKLPGNQQQLVEAVAAANPRTVVVLINAGPLTIPWIREHVPAIVSAWWSGEEQGHAVAEVLFGNLNPSGRLPYTVYASESHVPPQDEYDISKGFTYMYLKHPPLWPFGHGLSYTRFEYSDLELDPGTVLPDGRVAVRATVRNAGSRPGAEVVQLYTRDVEASVIRPRRELRGFMRIHLSAGESRKVEFLLPASSLAFYDVGRKQFVVEPGAFDILVGSSSEDIRLTGRLDVAAP